MKQLLIGECVVYKGRIYEIVDIISSKTILINNGKSQLEVFVDEVQTLNDFKKKHSLHDSA